jgi:hypothetical protein
LSGLNSTIFCESARESERDRLLAALSDSIDGIFVVAFIIAQKARSREKVRRCQCYERQRAKA